MSPRFTRFSLGAMHSRRVDARRIQTERVGSLDDGNSLTIAGEHMLVAIVFAFSGVAGMAALAIA